MSQTNVSGLTRVLTDLSLRAAAALVTCFVSSSPVWAASVEDFYRGKLLTIYVGFAAGGGYDVNARVLARHLGEHIPGHPTIVVEDMPGAGGLKLMNYLSKIAPRDGTAMATFARSMPFYPLFFSPVFDATKLNYIGSVSEDVSLCLTWHSSPIKNWGDLFTRQATLGGEGKGANPDIFAALLAKEFKAKVKLVTGYPGTADITLAMERGEVDGQCALSLGTVRSEHPDYLKGKANIIVQAGLHKDASLPDVPSLLDMAGDARARRVTELVVSPSAMARPYAAPPDLPADRLQALRTAFDATMKDPEFIRDATKTGLEVSPMSGVDVDALVRKLYNSPPEIVKEAAAVTAD